MTSMGTTRTLAAIAAAALTLAMGTKSYAQSPFGTTIGFETDADAFVPTNPSPPFSAPGFPGALPGAAFDFDDSRDTWVGLIEEVPTGCGGVTSHSGAAHAVIYPGANDSYSTGYRDAPYSLNGLSQTFPGAGNQWAWSIDLYAIPAIGTGSLWWTSAASDNTTGNYLTETGFNITPGGATWSFTLTAGGHPSISLPTGAWYHLEVVYDRSAANVQAYHRIYDSMRTTLLYEVLIPSGSMFLNPPSTMLGGPLYSWFTVWDNNAADRLYIDNLRSGVPNAAVQNLNTSETFQTIQDAINDSNTLNGHTLKILGAEHIEGPQVVFTKSLTLTGTGVEEIQPAGNTATSGDARGWFLTNPGTVCHFTGLEFNGSGYLIWDGLRILGSGSVSGCRFREIKFNPSGPHYAGRAIASVGDGPINVTNNDLAQCGRIGMYWAFPATNGSLCEGNVYLGKGVGDWLDYGIEVESGASITARANTIADCLGVASVDGSVSGAVLATTFFAPGTNIDLSHNTLRDNTYGLALGFNPGDTTTCTAHHNSIVDNDFGVDHTNAGALVNAVDNWWGSDTGPADPLGTNEASPGNCFPPSTILNADGLGNSVSEGNVAYCPWLESPATLSLIPNDFCYEAGIGGTVTVRIRMSQVKSFIVGGQFFLSYDNNKLDYVSTTAGAFPFTQVIFALANEGLGTIDCAVGVVPPHPGTPFDTDMITLTFNALQEVCSSADLVEFRPHAPPTQLTNVMGDAIAVFGVDLPIISIDGTDPVITPPANINVNSDAGVCTAAVTVPALAADDNCSAVTISNNSPYRTSLTNASGTYPQGATLFTWTVTDACGNQSQVNQTVTVSGLNEVVTSVVLDGMWALAGALDVTRCITFDIFDCPGGAPIATISQEVDFHSPAPNMPAAGTTTLLVPCGHDYNCITARDKRHTLRRTAASLSVLGDGNFGTAGVQYIADFSVDVSNGLVGGNLNDDAFIDILDFGVFVGQYNVNYGTGDTDCLTPHPHADISGNGVVFTEDYTFIATNFLDPREANCCGAPNFDGGGHGGANPTSARGIGSDDGPVTRISVQDLKKRGMSDLVQADLNHDGWLDMQDIAVFLSGH